MAKRTGLYKIPDSKYWWMHYSVDGRLIRESTKTTNKTDAQMLLVSRKAKVAAGGGEELLSRSSSLTLGALADEYAETQKHQSSWASFKKGRLARICKEFGRMLPVANLTTRRVERFRSQRLQAQKDRQPEGIKTPKLVSPATVNRELAVLRHMIRKGVEWGMVAPVILQRVQQLKNLPESNSRQRFLAKNEIAQLIKACRNPAAPVYLWRIVTLALNTGMRKGEILGLTWDRVDLQHNIIRLEATATKNKKPRTIPLNAQAIIALSGLPEKIDQHSPVFVHSNGKALKAIKKSFGTAMQRAGIIGCRFHDLRHTFASHLVMAGVSLVAVRDLLGHSSLAMVSRYSHLSPSHGRHAVEAISL